MLSAAAWSRCSLSSRLSMQLQETDYCPCTKRTETTGIHRGVSFGIFPMWNEHSGTLGSSWNDLQPRVWNTRQPVCGAAQQILSQKTSLKCNRRMLFWWGARAVGPASCPYTHLPSGMTRRNFYTHPRQRRKHGRPTVHADLSVRKPSEWLKPQKVLSCHICLWPIDTAMFPWSSPALVCRSPSQRIPQLSATLDGCWCWLSEMLPAQARHSTWQETAPGDN